jgi:tetratricopeptide (TPR) repeat protein
MSAGRPIAVVLLGLAAVCGCGAFATCQSSPESSIPANSGAQPSSKQSSSQASDQSSDPSPEQARPQPTGSSSVKSGRENDGSYSGQTVRHYKVPAEGGQPRELTQAEESIEKRDYAAAEPLLRKVTDRDSANYVAWFDLGFVSNALGKTDEAIAAYRKSVAAKSDVFESNLNLGLLLAKAGEPEAEQFLRSATTLNPTGHVAEGQYRAWLSLGRVLEAAKPEEAIAAYQKASTLQPKEAEPYLSAGLLFEKEGKFSDAEQAYKQALAVDPKASDAVTGLANVYMRERRFGEAEEYLRRMLVAQPDYAAGHLQLGRVLAANGKYDDAALELKAGLKLAPGDLAAQRDLADLYASSGKPDQAEAAYRALLAAHPNDAELHHSLGQSLLRQKKFPEAQNEFLAAIKLKPDFGIAYGDLAFAADENKNYPLTIRALDVRVKLLPEEPITYFLRASAYDHLRDIKQASANYHLFLNTAKGKYPDQEWQAKHRLIALESKK